MEDDVHDSLADSFAEQGVAYETEIKPLFGTLRGAALTVRVREELIQAAQWDGPPDDAFEAVAIVDSHEPDRVLELVDRLVLADDPTTVRREWREDLHDLDVIEHASANGDAVVALARTGDVLYIANRIEHITSLIERRGEAGPLSGVEEFQRMRSELLNDALVFGFVDGSFLGELAFAEYMDMAIQAPGVDPSTLTAGFALTARSDGFGMEIMVAGRDGLGSVATAAMAPADIGRAAAVVPADTLVFFAASGLREAIESNLDSLEDADPYAADFVDELLAPLEFESGIDLRRDIVARLSGTYAVAVGGSDFEMCVRVAAARVGPAPAARRCAPQAGPEGSKACASARSASGSMTPMASSRSRGPTAGPWLAAGSTRPPASAEP